MADLKISQLTASTTPLAGTEVLPVVQSSTTKQVSVANLTAGRAVSVASVAITGGSSAPGVISKDATTGLQIRGLAGSGYDLELTNSGGLTSMTVATGGYKTKFWDDVSTLGNVVISTSGKGIDFSATPGTGTSELLADYEEGTWTPVISDGTNNATMGASNSGTYTRVGRMVTVIGYVQMSNKGSISGALRMTGLPFTVGSVYAGASVGFADGLNVTAGVTIGMYAAVSTTYTLLQKFSATTGSTDLLATDTTNSGQFIFSLTYFV